MPNLHRTEWVQHSFLSVGGLPGIAATGCTVRGRMPESHPTERLWYSIQRTGALPSVHTYLVVLLLWGFVKIGTENMPTLRPTEWVGCVFWCTGEPAVITTVWVDPVTGNHAKWSVWQSEVDSHFDALKPSQAHWKSQCEASDCYT